MRERPSTTTYRADALASLLEVSKRLNATLELDEIVRHVIQSARSVMHADAATLLLREDDELVFAFAEGGAAETLAGGAAPARIQLGEGLAGWVAAGREPRRFDDVYAEPHFDPTMDQRTGYRTHSMLCVPLVASDQLVGVAQVINRLDDDGQPMAFDDRDLQTFATFCELAAVALTKARLHQELLGRQRLEDELTMARELQQEFLDPSLEHPETIRFAARNLPARDIGGDFFDAFAVGDKLFITIGDVAGKGAAAAMRMARFTSEFRFVAQRTGSPESAMARANVLLDERHSPFVTMMLVQLDLGTGEAWVVNAGHPPAVLIGRGPAQLVAPSSGPPLGVVEHQRYEAQQLLLGPGEGLLLFTDGITEARAPDGAMYGSKRLLDHIDTHGDDVDGIFDAVAAFAASDERFDDQTLVSFGLHPQIRAVPTEDVQMNEDDRVQLNVPSHPKYMRFVRSLITTGATEAGFDEMGVQAIVLAVDEACTNIIRHAYDGDPTQTILVQLAVIGRKLIVALRDFGPQRDCTEFKSRDLDDIKPGGLGMHFIYSTMDTVVFDTDLPRGTLLTMTKTSPEPTGEES